MPTILLLAYLVDIQYNTQAAALPREDGKN